MAGNSVQYRTSLIPQKRAAGRPSQPDVLLRYFIGRLSSKAIPREPDAGRASERDPVSERIARRAKRWRASSSNVAPQLRHPGRDLGGDRQNGSTNAEGAAQGD